MTPTTLAALAVAITAVVVVPPAVWWHQFVAFDGAGRTRHQRRKVPA